MGLSATEYCAGTPYERGVCWYTAGDLDRAQSELEAIARDESAGHERLKATYFLARAKMRQKRWAEASQLWIRLFELSPSFYREWNGDFLLGVCRREEGRD